MKVLKNTKCIDARGVGSQLEFTKDFLFKRKELVMADIVEEAPAFLVAGVVLVVMIIGMVFLSSTNAVASPNSQPISVTTPEEDQASKVSINCTAKQDLGQVTRYDFKIYVNDLALFSQDQFENLLPVFIFKSAVIPAKKIGQDAIDPAKGISIPDPLKSNPLESTYTFESYEAISVDTFSPQETVLITFISIGESSTVVATECKNKMLEAFEKYRSSPTEFKLLHNLYNFTTKCQQLIKGTVPVQATNFCISDINARIDITDASVISLSTGENTNVVFTLKSITPITADKNVKIYVSCNSDDTKNRYLPQGDNYIEQKSLVTNKFSFNMICGGSDIEVHLIKNCIDKDSAPGCDNSDTAIVDSDVRLPPTT